MPTRSKTCSATSTRSPQPEYRGCWPRCAPAAGNCAAPAAWPTWTAAQPVNGDGFFRIGSNTKTFISVVVLQLVAEHRLSLDDTVGHWLPGVVHGNGNDGGTITVRELLQHTSGLHNYTDDLQAQITSPEAYRKLEFQPVQPARTCWTSRSPTGRTPPPAPPGTTPTPTTSCSE